MVLRTKWRHDGAPAFGMPEDETKEPSLADAWADTLSARSSPASLSSKIHDSDAEPETPSTQLADAWTTTLPPPPPKNETGVKLTLGDATRVGARALYTFYLGHADHALDHKTKVFGLRRRLRGVCKSRRAAANTASQNMAPHVSRRGRGRGAR